MIVRRIFQSRDFHQRALFSSNMLVSENIIDNHDALNRVIDELVTAINQGLLRLTYIQGLSPDELRAELGRRIHQISAHTGVTHTRSFRWVIELSVDDALAQEASKENLIQHLSSLHI